MSKPNVFTAVFRNVTREEAGALTEHPKWSAGSWSHALDARKEVEAALEAANARIAELSLDLERACQERNRVHVKLNAEWMVKLRSFQALREAVLAQRAMFEDTSDEFNMSGQDITEALTAIDATLASSDQADGGKSEAVAWMTPSDWHTEPLATCDKSVASAWRADSRQVLPLYTSSLDRIASILASEIECTLFEAHVSPALDVARKALPEHSHDL